jgi:two-component system response regulator YesN
MAVIRAAGCCVRNCVSRSTAYRRSELCRDALRVIERRFADEDLSLTAVAADVATSARQLQRVLAEVRGTTFRRELHRVRMERAAEMLRNGRCPIKEVAAATGHRNATQFSKAFRREYGVTPSSFQEAQPARVAVERADRTRPPAQLGWSPAP